MFGLLWGHNRNGISSSWIIWLQMLQTHSGHPVSGLSVKKLKAGGFFSHLNSAMISPVFSPPFGIGASRKVTFPTSHDFPFIRDDRKDSGITDIPFGFRLNPYDISPT
jgi:hypothetical protein